MTLNSDNFILGAYSCAQIELPSVDRDRMMIFGFCVRARFPAGHTGFHGHFRGNPLLPGFLHIELVLDVLREQFGTVELQVIHSAKFLRPIRPEQMIDLNLRMESNHAVAAELQVAEGVASLLVLGVSGLPCGLAQKS